ncbi:MAG: hypothetical protein LBU66_03220 [Treponema sp.]|jgi:hypothetical protein|nr:hypothetical protein [Treponema sp.]
MVLVKTDLEKAFKDIFTAMQDGSKTDEWMAEQVADAIQNYIKSGQVSTEDTGAAPGGSYAGDGVGSMVINGDSLKNKLKITYESGYGDDDLAAHIAADIDDVCAAEDIVSVVSTGDVTIPGAGTSSFSGPGIGKFTGDKDDIEDSLKDCFKQMNNISQGGDDYLAFQFASAVDLYLKAGEIKINLQAPFVSGAGFGGII